MDHVASAGKTEHRSVFSKHLARQPTDKLPGIIRPVARSRLVIDIWKAGAPAIDINAAGRSSADFASVAASSRPNNPLFVPESSGDASGGGQRRLLHRAIRIHRLLAVWRQSCGYLGRDPIRRWGVAPMAIEDVPLAKAYQAACRHEAADFGRTSPRGRLVPRGSTTQQQIQKQDITLGNYLSFTLNSSATGAVRRSCPRWATPSPLPTVRCLLYIAGRNVQVTFSAEHAGTADCRPGRRRQGQI